MEQRKSAVDVAAKERFSDEVGRLFDPLIEARLSKAERGDEHLQQTILFELCGLLGALFGTETYFIDHHETVLDELIDACRWKLKIGVVPFNELAQQSANRQADVRQWVRHIRERTGPEPDRLKRLTLLLTENDQQAVAYRTVRAFLYCLKDGKRKTTEFLFQLGSGRVELRPALTRPYLSDQIALRVYLFHTSQEASFIEEALTHIKNWVQAEIAGRVGQITVELEEGINDIVSQVKADFINKCHRKKDEPESFWLDVRLTTYLFAFVKQNHAVDKLLRMQKSDASADDEPTTDVFGPANEDEGGNGEREPIGNDPPGEDDHLAEQKSQVQRGLDRIGEECKKLINSRFDDNFGMLVPLQTLAIEYNEPLKTIASKLDACLKKLKEVVHNPFNR